MHLSFEVITLLQQQSFGRFFSIQRNSEHTWSSWLVLAGTLPLASGPRRDEVAVKRQNRPWLQTGKLLTCTQRPRLANRGKRALRLHKYFTSFKYCDNWSALVVTIQVQEPGLASIMNTSVYTSSFSSEVKPPPFQQEQKQSNENRKMGSWYETFLLRLE